MSDGFVKALDASELAPGETATATVNGTELAIVNLNGEFHALDSLCPHQEGPLGDGFVQGDAIVCPLHYWEFDIKSGEYLDDPTTCLKKYETKVEGGAVFVKVN